MTNGLEIKWEYKDARFGPGQHVATIGKWPVGSVHYATGSKGDNLPREQAKCRLPGLKEDLGKFETVDEAKARVEQAVAYWFKGLEA